MPAQMQLVAEELGCYGRQILVQVRSLVEGHDDMPVPRPAQAKLRSRVLRYEEVRCIQEPEQRIKYGVEDI